MSVLISLIIIGCALAVLFSWGSKKKELGRQVIPINTPRDGAFLRKLEAKARREYPGRTERWYRQKADQDFYKYRQRFPTKRPPI